MFRLRRNDAASQSIKRRTSITDPEFGEIKFRRSSAARYVRIKLMPDGKLFASLPSRAPIKLISQLIDESREELRQFVSSSQTDKYAYKDGDKVGKSHRLWIKTAKTDRPRTSVKDQQVRVILPASWQHDGVKAQDYIREACHKALRKEADAYLPRRLKYLADKYGFSYERVRFGNPKGRWGSYSSNGTVSLNIALMAVPVEIIDYVLIHELCHINFPHHQPAFWEAVAEIMPDYKVHRKALKNYSPYL